MSYLAAVASTDGKVVNQHFGRADRFHIVEVSEKGFRYKESRYVTPPCHRGSHDENGFLSARETLKDVSAVIVSKIGGEAENFLESEGFRVYEAPYPIETLMEKIVRDKIFDKDKWENR